MSAIYELYGRPLNESQADCRNQRLSGDCPFSGQVCDGGGNRHQTTINSSDDPELGRFYLPPLADKIVPAICTIAQGSTPWVVCPRRFLAFRNQPTEKVVVNHGLQSHERELLLAAGLPKGVLLGVWAEVKMNLQDEDSAFNYAFDFVIAPTVSNRHAALQIAQQLAPTGQPESSNAGRSESGSQLWPDLSHPYLIEIMTASTSGSDKKRDIGIRQGFCAALKGNSYEFPGINKRQVWGRMASQLFAKAALGEFWGGKTVWVVQDALLDYIMASTKMKGVNTSQEGESNLVHFVAMGFDPGQFNLKVKRAFSSQAGIVYAGGNDIADILLPKRMPHRTDLLTAMARKQPAALIQL